MGILPLGIWDSTVLKLGFGDFIPFEIGFWDFTLFEIENFGISVPPPLQGPTPDRSAHAAHTTSHQKLFRQEEAEAGEDM